MPKITSAKFREEYANSKNDLELSIRLNVTPGALRYWYKQLGLPRKYVQKAYNHAWTNEAILSVYATRTMTMRQLAKECGRSYSGLRHHIFSVIGQLWRKQPLNLMPYPQNYVQSRIAALVATNNEYVVALQLHGIQALPAEAIANSLRLDPMDVEEYLSVKKYAKSRKN